MHTDKRGMYLKLMGIDVFIPKHLSPDETHVVAAEANAEPAQKLAQVETHENAIGFHGLKWLSSPGSNGIIILLPAQQNELSTESRQLMIKMIQAIGVKASDCGYLSCAENDTDASLDLEPALDLNSVRGIIAFGKIAGDHLVHHSTARRVPGEHYFLLDNKPMIVTLHPDELVDTPELKRQAWNDLKLLDRLLNESHASA